MFWNSTDAWKDKLPDKFTLPKKRAPLRPTWSTMVIQQRGDSIGPSGGLRRRRPTTTSRSSDGRPVSLAARPNTAPALLTGEGLLVQSSHEDAFLQQLEDNEVKRVIASHRRQKLTFKVIKDVHDGSDLFELKAFHNACVRGRGFRRCRAELLHNEPSQLAAPAQLQELEHKFGENLRHHHYRLGIPRPPTLRSSLQGFNKIGPSGTPLSKRETMKNGKPVCTDELFKAEFKNLFRSTSVPASSSYFNEEHDGHRDPYRDRRTAVTGRPSSAPSPELAQVASILHAIFGSFRLAFQAIAPSGVLSLGDWEMALQEVAPDQDATFLFRYLGKHQEDGLTLDEFEEVFYTQDYQPSFSDDSASEGLRNLTPL